MPCLDALSQGGILEIQAETLNWVKKNVKQFNGKKKIIQFNGKKKIMVN